MPNTTCRATLLMTAGATWAAALEAHAGDPPNVRNRADAQSEAGRAPREPSRFRATGARDDDAGGLGVHQQRRRRRAHGALERGGVRPAPAPPARPGGRLAAGHSHPALGPRAAPPDPPRSDFQSHAGPPRGGGRDGTRGGGRWRPRWSSAPSPTSRWRRSPGQPRNLSGTPRTS